MENIGTLLALLYVFFWFRYCVTLFNRFRIEDAIYDYDITIVYVPGARFINPFDVMEPGYKTFWRLWDYGYKRIIPKETYELIKEYVDV